MGRPRASRDLERLWWREVRSGVGVGGGAVAVGVSELLARRWLAQGGGVPTIELDDLSGRYLSMREREEIAVGLAAKLSHAEIARRLGRHRSTIGREIRRNKPATHPYRATSAHPKAQSRARRPKVRKLAGDPVLAGYVQGKLEGRQRWSPEQISRRIELDHPDDEGMRISHEAIYQALYVQGRGGLRRELHTCLRTGRAMRKPQRRPGERQHRIKDMVLISERPAEVADRAVPGHWEGDLIVGANNGSAIGTLVERSTRFTMLLHLPDDHTAPTVRDAITATIATLPAQLRKSLTWDQGIELAEHVQLRLDTDLQIYFCDPRSPWQRGTNENTNGLLRQYFPKGTDLSVHTTGDLDDAAAGLNGRPRKTLHWKTPAEALAALIATVNEPGVATTP